MSDRHEPEDIAIAIVEHGDRYIIGQRPAGKTLAGFWEFPGGKVEVGETVFQATERECLEETGLNVRAESVLCDNSMDYDHGTVHLYFVGCALAGPMRRPLAPFRWVQRQDLRHFRFPTGNKQVLNLLTQ